MMDAIRASQSNGSGDVSAYWSFRVNIDFFQGMLSRHNSAMRRLPRCCGIERQVAPVTQLIIVMSLHGSSTRCIGTFTCVS
jgi:hypothetical protein